MEKISKEEFYREKLHDEQMEDRLLEQQKPDEQPDAQPTATVNFIKQEYRAKTDRHAKKNRDSHAQELREQGYHVTCSRTTDLRGRAIYILFADKEQPTDGMVTV